MFYRIALSCFSFLFFNLEYSFLKSGTVFQSLVYIIQIDNLDDGKACSDLGPAWPSVSKREGELGHVLIKRKVCIKREDRKNTTRKIVITKWRPMSRARTTFCRTCT